MSNVENIATKDWKELNFCKEIIKLYKIQYKKFEI